MIGLFVLLYIEFQDFVHTDLQKLSTWTSNEITESVNLSILLLPAVHLIINIIQTPTKHRQTYGMKRLGTIEEGRFSAERDPMEPTSIKVMYLDGQRRKKLADFNQELEDSLRVHCSTENFIYHHVSI